MKPRGTSIRSHSEKSWEEVRARIFCTSWSSRAKPNSIRKLQPSVTPSSTWKRFKVWMVTMEVLTHWVSIGSMVGCPYPSRCLSRISTTTLTTILRVNATQCNPSETTNLNLLKSSTLNSCVVAMVTADLQQLMILRRELMTQVLLLCHRSVDRKQPTAMWGFEARQVITNISQQVLSTTRLETQAKCHPVKEENLRRSTECNKR